MKRHIIFLLLVTLLCSVTSSALAQVTYQSEVEAQYKQGVKLYQNADYTQAATLFSRLVDTAIPHQRITASYLLYGKSLLKTNQAEAGILALQKVINVYPTSDYLDDAHFEMGSAFYQLSNYLSATREMGWVLDYSSDTKLQTKARQVLEFLLETRLDAQELFDLLDEIPAENMRGFILS
ncbi:tetratricopeptide repeat protein, partial [bacterium]|nr:tetratricopeptide repeat protein [bacterium]